MVATENATQLLQYCHKTPRNTMYCDAAMLYDTMQGIYRSYNARHISEWIPAAS